MTITFTTHIICAYCGKDNVIKSHERNIGTLHVVPGVCIELNCQHCAKTYPIIVFNHQHPNPLRDKESG